MNWLEEICRDIVSLFYCSLDKNCSSLGTDQLLEKDYAVILVSLNENVDDIFNG
jgi:hypothetical protein